MNSSFVDNRAGVGSSLNVVGAQQLTIKESEVAAGSLESTTGVDLCRPGICAIGLQCTQKDDKEGVFCVPCSQTTYGNGNTCETCPAGAEPTAAQDGCTVCPPNHASEDIYSNCRACPAGKTNNERHTECQACPHRETTSGEGTECRCKDNLYDTHRIGDVSCDGFSRTESVLGDRCAICPPCLDCTDGVSTALKPGWAFYGLQQAYRCKGNAEVAEAACPGGVLNNLTAATADWKVGADGVFAASVLDRQCGAGSTGPICANCDAEHHHIKTGQPCQPCDDGSVNIAMLIGILIAILLLASVIATGLINKFADHGIVTDLRLLVGFWQQLAQMSNVLAIVFPYPIPFLLDILSFTSLDIRKLLKLDCWDLGACNGRTRVSQPTVAS